MSLNFAHSLEPKFYLKRKIVITLAFIIIFVVTIEIWAANRLSTFGERINGLESTKYSLSLENDYLKNAIAYKQSLLLNSKKSSFLGFKRVKSIEYLNTEPKAFNSNKF